MYLNRATVFRQLRLMRDKNQRIGKNNVKI